MKLLELKPSTHFMLTDFMIDANIFIKMNFSHSCKSRKSL